jgi:hypothetical protein
MTGKPDVLVIKQKKTALPRLEDYAVNFLVLLILQTVTAQYEGGL